MINIDKSKFKCENCLWFEQCCEDEVCDDFSPTDEMLDEYIDKIIEENRIKYHKEWFEYVDEYNN